VTRLSSGRTLDEEKVPMSPRDVEVVEFTDPGCIWSWSSSPKLRWLYAHVAPQVTWRRVFGIGYEDMSRGRLDFDRVGSVGEIVAGWSDVVAETGAPLRIDHDWIFASSALMSRAARAATLQGGAVGDRVLRQLREAVFVLGRGPDTTDELRDVLSGIPGLDLDRLVIDLDSPAVAAAVESDWKELRDPHPEVLALQGQPGGARQDGDHLRYGLPTILVTDGQDTAVVPGWRPLEAYVAALAQFDPGLVTGLDEKISPEVALETFGTLTSAELELFTGDSTPPPGAVALETPSGTLYVRASDVAARHLEALAGDSAA
jgi:predicted DsbA family dithiol-disulfide isomerase